MPRQLTPRVDSIILFLFQNTVDWTCPMHDHRWLREWKTEGKKRKAASNEWMTK